MTAFNIWGNAGNQAYALPMVQLTPTLPDSQGYTLAWDITEQGFNFAPLNWDFSTGDATSAGNFGLAASKAYKIDSLQVLGERIVGWAAATGTDSRLTFDTATVTTAQLAQRVKALIDDLLTHGLIGTA